MVSRTLGSRARPVMKNGVAIVATDGNGALAGYARALSALVDNPTVTVRGCSGSFGHSLLSRYSLRSLADDAAIVRRLRALDAPLLHLTSHHLARYGPFAGGRYVVTVHDLIRHRDMAERETRSPLIHEPNRRDELNLRLDAAGVCRADALIAVSEHTRRELIELLDIESEKIHVVHEGVDLDAFRPVARRLLDDPYVLYVGKEQPRKNLATLFRAFARLQQRRPGLKLVKVGAPGGPEAPFREQTLAHACEHRVLSQIVFAERVSHDELVAWYSGAVCLVQPSLHEGFGLTPLEAMACGCPVLVSSGGALPEVTGDAGVVYGAPEDADALAWELSRLLESDAERAALSRAGLRRAQQMTWTRTARQTREVWRSVVGEPLPVSGRPRAGGPSQATGRDLAGRRRARRARGRRSERRGSVTA
jgi:glycosyltransferase involved in cell wall biosynthesis